jgi:glycosyltransferase involved in cell wall biosynthesis
LAALDHRNHYLLYSDRPLPSALSQTLPPNFRVKVLPFFRLWTQLRLPVEVRRDRVQVLWIPASAMPVWHPRHTVVTIHGLEYEYFPRAYSLLQRTYLKFSTRFAIRHAWRLITVSENTKRDLISRYRADPARLRVVYHGFSVPEKPVGADDVLAKLGLEPQRYFVCSGRLETRKNIVRLIQAFDRWRTKTLEPYRLVLAGRPGTGFSEIKKAVQCAKSRIAIVRPGYLDRPALFTLLAQARAMVYPTLYEGFGLPILESFAVGTPVVCSQTASLPEVGGAAVIYVDPLNVDAIAWGLEQVVSEPREKRQQARAEQLHRFSWEKCAREHIAVFEAA